MDNENGNSPVRIPLDGSFGPGVIAELTIITKQNDAEKEETFIFPYMLIDFTMLQRLDGINLIKGYRIIKQEKPSALKELGL